MNCSDAPIIDQISDIRLISIITKKSDYQCRLKNLADILDAFVAV